MRTTTLKKAVVQVTTVIANIIIIIIISTLVELLAQSFPKATYFDITEKITWLEIRQLGIFKIPSQTSWAILIPQSLMLSMVMMIMLTM